MRLFIILGLMVSILSMQDNAYGAALTSDQMCAALRKELGETFCVTKVEDQKVTLGSSSCDRTVIWYSVPEKVLDHEGLELFNLRFDNLGQGNLVYAVLIENLSYHLFLNGSRLCLRITQDTPRSHINLIKTWLATRKMSEVDTAAFILRHQGE
jgi:hypothetical protein